MKSRLLFAVIFLFFVSVANAQQPAALPLFTFYKLDGKPVSNINLKAGKKNLFILFDCTCEHCQRETKLLNTNYAAFKDVNIYMITLDEAYIIPKFFDSYAKGLNAKPNVTVLQDKKQIFIPTFLPSMYPAMYLYSPQGKLLAYNAGDGGIKKMLKTNKK
jgi:hypothetical protein